jgi:5'-3' exonuclease
MPCSGYKAAFQLYYTHEKIQASPLPHNAYGLIYRSYFVFLTRPRRLAAVFDSRTPTFRHKMYKEYKATRQKAPEDLHA